MHILPIGAHYSSVGNRIVSLSLLGDYVQELTEHAAACGDQVQLLGESAVRGLCSVLVARCCKCGKVMKMHTSDSIRIREKNHFTVNVGAVLGQIATGGGGDHLAEQLTTMNIPALSPHTFVEFERDLGLEFERIVTEEMLSAGKEEYNYALATGCIHGDDKVPACTVVVDGGWSKRAHKHSYNAKSGVGIIFGMHTKKLLFIGVRNKYCSICAIATRKGVQVPNHKCFKNWSSSSCSLESDIIVEGFNQSETMHGLRYIWMVGDGDSSVYLSVTLNVSYGLGVHKVECANHAIKCFRSGLEKLAKENAGYSGKHGLTPGRIQRICRGMKCAIRQHSLTNDVAALRHDLRNCPHHCFGDHKNCRSSFCKNAGKEHEGNAYTQKLAIKVQVF